MLTVICFREYLPELEKARETRNKTLQAAKEDSVNRLMKDLAVDRARNPEAAARDKWDPAAEEEEDDDDLDVNILDRSKPLCHRRSKRMLSSILSGEGPWPGQYIDITRARRHENEDISWPRPG